MVQILRTRSELSAANVKSLVPTMGALHEGHLSLISTAPSPVAVSIFVNKKQFNRADDFENYPSRLDNDIEFLKQAGVEYLFLPEHEEVYQEDHFSVSVNSLANCLCGKGRPGHFDGVANVVLRLLSIAKAEYVCFGEKDFQQLLLVEKLVQEFSIETKVIRVPTVRENSGLALSSRNLRLSNSDRQNAAEIFQALSSTVETARSGESEVKELMSNFRNILRYVETEYAEVRSELNLELLEKVTPQCRVFFAGTISGVRLIDNMKI